MSNPNASAWSFPARRDSMEDIAFDHTTDVFAPTAHISDFSSFGPPVVPNLPAVELMAPAFGYAQPAEQQDRTLQQPWVYVPSAIQPNGTNQRYLSPPSTFSAASSPQFASPASTFSDNYQLSPGSHPSPSAVPMFQPKGIAYTPFSWNYSEMDHQRIGDFSSNPGSPQFSDSPPSSVAASYQDRHRFSPAAPVTPTPSYGVKFEASPSAESSPEREISPEDSHLPMVSINSSSMVDEEKTEPYAQIIYRALMDSPDRKMVLADIYRYFQDNLPKRAAKDGGWKNSIRHNLSMNGVSLLLQSSAFRCIKLHILTLSQGLRQGATSLGR